MARPAPLRSVALLAVTSAALSAAIQRRQSQKKDLEKQGEAQSLASRCVQVLTAWMLENGTILAMACLLTRLELFPPRNQQHPLRMMLKHATLSFIVSEVSWVIQWAFADFVYHEVPYFAPVQQRPRVTFVEFVQNWARLFIPLRIINGVMAVGQIHSLSQQAFEALVQVFDFKSQGPLSFLLQFIVARGLFDLGFWGSHRVIHFRSLYRRVHKKHHEHREPFVLTNGHFGVVDLFLEGTVPLLLALQGLEAMQARGLRLTPLQRNYIIYSFVWYLNVSHIGKPVPVASVFPPLSFLPIVDRKLGGGVAHHHAHHRFTNCNYGIAAWPDKLFGTFQPLQKELPEEPDSAA